MSKRNYITGNPSGKFTTNDLGEGWTFPNNPTDSLYNMSQDLSIDEDPDFERNNISVPSPWATVILFDSLLSGSKEEFKSLAAKSLKEWRALIYMLATNPIDGNYITFKSVDLEGKRENFADKEFFNNIIELRPKASLFDDNTSWKKLVFINIENYNIAAVTDSFLVCSNHTYHVNSATRFLQYKGFMDDESNFIDPTESISKDYSLSVYMICWLKKLKQAFPNNRENETVTSLCNIIDNFINDIYNSLSAGIRDFIRKLCDEGSFLSFRFKSQEFNCAFDILNNIVLNSVKFDGQDEILDFLRLKSFDVYMMDGFGAKLSSIIKVPGCIVDGLDNGNTVIIGKDSLFMDNITLLDCTDIPAGLKGAFDNERLNYTIIDPNTKAEKKYQILLPIKTDIFKYISTSYFSENIKLDISAEYIDISVEFILKNTENKGIVLSKRYSVNKAAVIDKGTISIAMYPYCKVVNIKEPAINVWKEYYTYIMTGRDNGYDVLPGCGGVTLDDFNHGKRRLNMSSSVTDISIVKHLRLPEYLSFIGKNEDFGKEFGIYILPAPVTYDIDENVKCIIGVDMGTTSTTVFGRISNHEETEKFIRFGKMEGADISNDIGDDNSCVKVVCSDSVYNDFIHNSFIPENYIPRKAYPSSIRCNAMTTTDNFMENPFFFGNIIYNQMEKNELAKGKIYTNFKWGSRDEDSRALQSYLGQIMRSTAVTLTKSGVGSLSWRFSYPSSLPEDDIIKYKQMTNTLVQKISDIGIESITDRNHCYYPESIVSAKFYAEAHPYICIDIGGGSTDVSMWEPEYRDEAAPKNVMQFSLGIASRKIFMKGLRTMLLPPKTADGTIKNEVKEIRSRIDSELMGIKSVVPLSKDGFYEKLENNIDMKESEIENEFIKVFEPILQLYGDCIKENLANNMSNSESFIKLRRFFAVGLWSILYYILMTLETHKDEIGEQLKENSTIVLNFAGNGSRVYSWIEDEFGSCIRKAFENKLNDVFDKKLCIAPIEMSSQKLKTEAACGLIRMDVPEIEFAEKNEYLINGDESTITFADSSKTVVIPANEDINKNPYIRSWYSRSNPQHVEENHVIFNKDCEEDSIVKFINSLNENLFTDPSNRLKQPLNIDDIDNISVQAFIDESFSENTKTKVLAPAYIMKIEALLKVLPDVL